MARRSTRSLNAAVRSKTSVGERRHSNTLRGLSWNLWGKERTMKATLEKAWGYQGDNMNLPVPDLATALPFYETVLGFRVLSRSDTPHNSAVLTRDRVQI